MDGTRGRLVFITPTNGKDDNDLHYLLRWADSFRLTKLPNGDVIRGSGRAVIFADILDAVLTDIPKAAAVSLSLTILTVFLAFGRGRAALEVVGSLAVGLLWLMLLLYLGRIKINFFNFVALPITFGIGVDYAVNVMQRVLERRRGHSRDALHRRRGGAQQPDHHAGVPGAARLGEPGGALAGHHRGARARSAAWRRRCSPSRAG